LAYPAEHRRLWDSLVQSVRCLEAQVPIANRRQAAAAAMARVAMPIGLEGVLASS